jgi:ribonuclease BN (tRNA processing enzyme)
LTAPGRRPRGHGSSPAPPHPTLILLGTGGETENPSRLGPAIGFASGTTVVLADAGRGVAGTLRKASIALAQPSSVYLTSLLPENTVGLDDLLTAGWRAGREHPLRLVGPPGTETLARGLEAAQAGATQALSDRLGLHAEGARFVVQEIEGPWSDVEGGIAVEARPLSGGALPSLGFRFEAAGRSLVVAGLVHGAVFSDSVRAAVEAGAEDAERIEREASLQISLRELAGAARQARVGHLVLVRLRPPPLFDFQFEQVVAERYDGRVSVAQDGDELTL